MGERNTLEAQRLNIAAAAINTWNRIAIAFRVPPQVDSKGQAP